MKRASIRTYVAARSSPRFAWVATRLALSPPAKIPLVSRQKTSRKLFGGGELSVVCDKFDSASNTVTLPAVMFTNAKFPPNFSSGDATNQPWVRSCLRLTTAIRALPAGCRLWTHTVLEVCRSPRLTQIQGTACP